jgi:hypothetical protein
VERVNGESVSACEKGKEKFAAMQGEQKAYYTVRKGAKGVRAYHSGG